VWPAVILIESFLESQRERRVPVFVETIFTDRMPECLAEVSHENGPVPHASGLAKYSVHGSFSKPAFGARFKALSAKTGLENPNAITTLVSKIDMK
jgi:hypothetical protein